MNLRFLALTVGLVLGFSSLPGLISAEEDWGGLVGDERIELIQQMIKERGECWTAGHTSVSDLTDEEKLNLKGLIPAEFDAAPVDPMPIAPSDKQLPTVFDWRDTYKVTWAKNQGQCGSCWAFGPTGVFESLILIHDEQEFDLSEQQIVSCVSYGFGCNGYQPREAFKHFRDYGGIQETCMPYVASDVVSCTEDFCELVANLTQYYQVVNTVTDIKNAVYNYGPVSTGIHVYDNFFYYHGGCYTNNVTYSTDHCVSIVGWDDTACDGAGAWIIKNSWGTGWGENGFGYVEYGTCGIGLGTYRATYSAQLHLLKFMDYTADPTAKAGDGDGFLDPGETATLEMTLMNDGKGGATGVSGVLRTSTPGVTITDSTADFSDMPSETAGSTVAPHFEIGIDFSLAPGDWIEFELELSTATRAASVTFPVYVGEFTEVLADDFETDQGWTIGAPDDDATDGIWERVATNEKRNPMLDKVVQPAKDTTVYPGTLCFVTENSPLGTVMRFDDVDGGKTTLLSPIHNLSGYEDATLTYQRFYQNDYLNPDNDTLTVDVSNDGGSTWVNVEMVTETPQDRIWHQFVFDLDDLITLTDQMRVRYVAQDVGLNSLVEVTVDDVEIRGFIDDMTVVADGGVALRAPGRVVLGQNVPNPFNPETVIPYGLPKPARVVLSVYNVRGQRVRQLVDDQGTPGFHTASWDGRDGNGKRVSSGVYFYRLEAGDLTLTRRMVLIK